MALGDELGADDDVELALRDRRELAPQPLRAARKVARQDDGARVREALRDLLGDALHPRPAGRPGNRRLPQAGQASGRRSTWPQWWQTRAPAEAVLDQPGGAVRALEAMAAGPAQRQRRIAAPVEEEQRLLAARRGSRPWPRQGSATSQRPFGIASRRAGRRRGSAGSGRPPKRSRQDDVAVAAALGIDAALDRGRRRGEDRPARLRSARAPPPCRGRGSGRRPPACRRPRAPRRRR